MDSLPRALLDQFWDARTPFVVLAFVIVATIARRDARVERYHTSAATTLLLGHVIALVVAAGLGVNGYDAEIAQVVALAFELLAVVSLGMTLLFRILLPRVGLPLPRILIDLLTAVGVIVVFIVVGKRAGFSVAGLITTSAVLTAVIGFSLQDTLGNVMGGLSLQLDKSVSVGDWVSLGPGQATGRVIEIRWRYTAIETRAWETVIVPNGALVKSHVTILGRRIGEPSMLRRHIELFVDFRTPPTEVLAAIRDALAKPIPNVAQEPQPQALFFGIRDSFAVYAARYWLTDLAADDPTDSAVRVRLWFALRRAGIPMSIPASAVFLTHETPERDERKASDEHEQRLRALATVDLFSGLAGTQREALAEELIFMPFAAGETVTREGETDDGLYILIEGQASVRIGTARDGREVATLGAGQFFGEMSLMTGEARTATVVATSDLVTYRIDKPAFEAILRASPGLADQIAETLVARRTALTAARDEHDDVRRTRLEHAKRDLVAKIRGFFGIDSRA